MSVPLSGGYYRPGAQINFEWISQAWRSFQAQAGAWIGAMALYLLVLIVVGIPLAFATGYASQVIDLINTMKGQPPPTPTNPFGNIGHSLLFNLLTLVVQSVLLGGLYRMAVRQGRGEAIKATDVFSAVNVALPLIGVVLITQLLTVIGFYLCIVPALIVGGLFMFAPLLVVDRRLGPIQAITESVGLLRSQLLMAALFFLVVSLINFLGALLGGLGVIVTYPLLVISTALAYLAFTQTGQVTPDPSYGVPQPGVWPPPPTDPGTPPPGQPPLGGL